MTILFLTPVGEGSPSSQRVWIEIVIEHYLKIFLTSRPLHRGCGLKFAPVADVNISDASPSSQRVWIEIVLFLKQLL